MFIQKKTRYFSKNPRDSARDPTGRHFDSGWSKTGPPAPKAWVPKNTLRGKARKLRTGLMLQYIMIQCKDVQ